MSPIRPAKKTMIAWKTPYYGVVEFDVPATSDLPFPSRFGIGDSPLNIGGGGGGDEPPPEEECCGTKVRVYKDTLDADTDTDVTLETWTELPGMERTVAVPKPSTAVLHVQLCVECTDIATVDGAQYLARVLLNGEEIDGRLHYSVTDSDLRLPGKTDKRVITLHLQATWIMQPNVDYTYTIEMTNSVAATTYTTLEGTTGTGKDTNMILVIYEGTEQEAEAEPTDEYRNYVVILDFCYNNTDDTLYVLRERISYLNRLPDTIAGTTPEKAYVEVVTYALADIPITKTIGGTLLWKREITQSTWEDVRGWAMGCQAASGSSGAVAFTYANGDAGTTAYSVYYNTVMISGSGIEIINDLVEGPNWHEVPKGDCLWGPDGYCYMIEPTVDNTANTGPPYKSGKRATKRSPTSGAIGTTWAIECMPTHRVRLPLALTLVSSTVYILYAETFSVGNKHYYLTALSGISGGSDDSGDEVTFDTAIPVECGSVIWIAGSIISPTWTHIICADSQQLYLWNSADGSQSLWDTMNASYEAHINMTDPTQNYTEAFVIIGYSELVAGNSLTAPWIQSFDGG